MTSSIRPTNMSRVTMLMQSNLLLSGIRSTSNDLLKVQNQLTTGLKLNRPSDDPAEATTIMHLDGQLERQNQYLKNIQYAEDYLSVTDNALGQSVELMDGAYTLALESIGAGITEDGRQSNALLIDEIINQMVTISNYSCRNSYVFGGQNTTQMPFESSNGGVMYYGDLGAGQTRVAQDHVVNFNITGHQAFSSLSSQIQGIADLNPDITVNTLLSDLNGGLGDGVRLSSVIISDGTSTDTVDLSGCVTVGDVISRINEGTDANITAAISADGTSLTITSLNPGADLTVTEMGTGTTARDLGIYETAGAGAALNGQDVDARLSLNTPVTALGGGAGIDLNNGLMITNSLISNNNPIDLSAAVTLGDILNTINQAGRGVRAQINSDGTGMDVLNQLSGSEMTIGENGGTTATDLGIRSFCADTQLSDLNGGQGVATVNSDGEEGVIRITARDGSSYDVNLATAETVQDVIDLINTATAGHVTAGLAASGNGIVLTDTVSGAGDLSVETISENNYFVAQQLGLQQSVSADTLTGDDVNPIKPDGVFSHLMALRDAMSMGGDAAVRDAAISAAAEALKQDYNQLSQMHGIVGSTMRAVEERRYHMEDNILATETLRSDIRDVDYTEVITRYQNLYTALQGNLMTGGLISDISLLDFLG